MKKIIVCNITMKEEPDRCAYKTQDLSLPVSEREVIYPINAFLEKTLVRGEEIKVVMLVKKDKCGNYRKNTALFVEELMDVNETVGAKIEFKTVESNFDENQSIHEELLGMIVDELEDGSRILADITYGPKDVPIILFSALGFAEKFLGCEIENIIYGQATFVGGKPTDTKICDMVPLYYLNSVINAIHSEDGTRARQMLKSLLSI